MYILIKVSTMRPRIFQTFFITLILITSLGCASRNLVPISDSGIAYPDLLRVTKTMDGVAVVVNSTPWYGPPDSLERYITPIHVEIQNNSPNSLNIRYDDFVLIDQNRTQYNPLTPQIVADMLKTASESRYWYGPSYPSVSIGLGFGYFSGGPFYGGGPLYWPYYSPFYMYGGFPLGYYAPGYYSPPSAENVYTKALNPGQLNPNARLLGFVYFPKLPKEVKLVTLDVGYQIHGKPESYKFSFPFEYR